MLIITGAVVTISISNLKTKNLTNMYADLKSLNDKIAVYYNSYGQLPVKEKFTGSYDFVIAANPNDDAELYYVIDASKLNNLILANNISWSGDDVYIINEKTHMIYYPKGVSLDGEMYYRLPGEYNEVDKTIIDKTDVAGNPTKYYGAYVTNFISQSGDPNVGWRIFHADENNIYLIADNYIHFDYAPQSKNYSLTRNTDYKLSFDDVYKDYSGARDINDNRLIKWINYLSSNSTSANENIRAVAFMLDTTIWNKYANYGYVEYAIGGPTLELFIASYNKVNPNNQIYYSYNDTGYQIKWSDDSNFVDEISGLDSLEDLYIISNENRASAMWIASPHAYSNNHLTVATCNARIEYRDYTSAYSYPGFRPVVCLKSDTLLEKQSDGTYLIIEDADLNESIQITPSTIQPTKDDITVTVTYQGITTNLAKEISIDGGITWVEYTGPITVSENCTIQARLRDTSNQIIKIASLIIRNIDKAKPIVEAITENVTIEEGMSNELSKYFTYSANGTAKISSVTYTDTSDGNKEITNTNTLSIGNHVIKCTVEKETGLTEEATITIIVVNTEEGIEIGEGQEVPDIYVAKIDTKYYKKLQYAVNAVPTNNTQTKVELLKTVSEDIEISNNKNIILELNQNTVSNVSNVTILSSGTLKIQNGTIKSTGTNSLNNSGTMELGDALTLISNGYPSAINNENATMTINGATITPTNGNGIRNRGNLTVTGDTTISTTSLWAIANESNGNVTMTSGTINSTDGNGIYNEGILTINGTAQINAAVYNGESATTVMDDGTISVSTTNGIANHGTLAITGDATISSVDIPSVYNHETGLLTVSGGTISSEKGNAINNKGTTNISQTAKITSNSSQYGTLYNSGTLTMTGGTASAINCGVLQNTAEVQIEGTAKLLRTTTSENAYSSISNANGAKLTISGGEIITEEADSITNSGELIINGNVNITNTGTTYESFSIINLEQGQSTITAGTITTEMAAIGNRGQIIIGGNTSIYTNSTEKICMANEKGKMIINGGTITAETGNIINNVAEIEIAGTANLISNAYENRPAVINKDSGIITINGGTITSKYAYGIYNYATININDGSLISNSSENTLVANFETGEMTITGGTLSSQTANVVVNLGQIEIGGTTNIISYEEASNNPAVANSANGNMIISGGNFTVEHAHAIHNLATMSITNEINIVTKSGNNSGILNNSTGNMTISSIINFDGNTNPLINNGNVTINEGTSITAGGAGSPILNNVNATALITGGTIKGENLTNAIINKGTLEITGTANISASREQLPTVYNIKPSDNTSMRLIISGGNIYSGKSMAVYNQELGELTISGTATLTNSVDEQPVVYIEANSTLTMNGGNIKAGNTNAIYNRGIATISGTAYLESSGASYPTIYNRGTITIEGGTIKNTASGGYATYNNGGTINLRGGNITGTVG